MTQRVIQRRTVASNRGRAPAAKAPWHWLALAAVLILSAFLNLFRLTNEGYGITYYAAAVKDMLTSWHNFFFVSFDAGFVSVDKPPLGLWIQAASAYLFGFHGLSLMLPQALAGVLCVAVLYHLVRCSFGQVAGLLAALALAVTPIVVATSRNNTMDMLLVLTVLLAAWAVVRAAESGSLGWLLVGAVVLGLGFNIKMLEAYLVLPAFYLLYLLASPVSWRRRFAHLGVATVVLLVLSLSWAVAVDLTPADQRPYVGSTSDDTVTNLILGYNGLDRLTGPSDEIKSNGARGPFRLINQYYAGQIGWLLPLAVVGLVAASPQRRPRLPLDRRQGALVLWGTWFLTAATYFSVAGVQHRYYTVMLAPAVAALVGVGVVALWNDYRNPDRSGWFLPLALMVTATLHARTLGGYGGWGSMLTPVIVGLCLSSAAVLVVLRASPKPKAGAYAAVATAVGMLALLIAPTIWASYTVFQGPRGSMPAAGPPHPQPLEEKSIQGATGVGNPSDSLPSGGVSGESSGNTADPALMSFLLANQGDAKYLVAVTSSRTTAPLILNTNEPVISLGGYKGVDPVFTTERLAGLVHEGAVRFFLIPDAERTTQTMLGDVASQQPSWQYASPGPLRNESAKWVQNNCRRVPRERRSPNLGQGEESSMKPLALYDCGLEGNR